MYYKILMKQGHMGAGKSLGIVRYIESDNVETPFDRLKTYPGLKSKKSGRGVSMVKPISRQEEGFGIQEEVYRGIVKTDKKGWSV